MNLNSDPTQKFQTDLEAAVALAIPYSKCSFPPMPRPGVGLHIQVNPNPVVPKGFVGSIEIPIQTIMQFDQRPDFLIHRIVDEIKTSYELEVRLAALPPTAFSGFWEKFNRAKNQGENGYV